MSEDTSDNKEVIQEPVAVQVPTTEAAEVPAKKTFRLTRKTVIMTVILAIIFGGGATAYVLLQKDKPEKVSSSPETSQKEAVKQPVDDTQTATAKNIITTTGITFYGTPKKLSDLNFIADYKAFGGEACDTAEKCSALTKPENVSYYEIGTLKDGSPLITVHIKPASIEVLDYLALGGKDGTYRILAKHSGNGEVDDTIKAALTSKVTIDATTVLTDLQFPKEVTVAGQKLITDFSNGYFLPMGMKSIRGGYFGDLKDSQTTDKIESFGDFTLYRVTVRTTDNYKITELYGALGTTLATRYSPNGELASTKDKLPITWSTGEQEAISAYSGGGGCGSVGYVAAQNINASSLKQIGTSKAGQKIYQLPSGAALEVELYNEDYAKGVDNEAPLKNLTLQQFLDKHAYFLVENGLKDYVVFQRTDMFSRGGCGKPVVYLYPTTPTDISVKVAADVIVSTPHYEPNGWQHVLAQPDGSLTYRGTPYDSLYWEGYGHGAYPDITSGTVIKSSEAVSTIKSQLKAQGFNGKETADFLAYWQAKLPTTPYTRLTWFSTGQMNQLAPLTISPRPHTVIRTFLDFEGLQKPVALASQTFTAPKRSGFTVTEWGGLLRNGIRQ